MSSCRCYNCNGKYEVQLGEYCEHCGKKDYGVYQYAYCSECKKVYTENHPSFCKKDGSKIINKQLVKISEVNTSETELKNGICAIRVDIFTIDAFFLIGILLSGVGVFDKNNHPEKKTVRKEVRYE